MLDDTAQAEIIAITRTTRIIVFALCMGVVTFGVVAVMSAPQQPAAGTLTYASLGFAGLAGVLSLTIPQVVIRSGRRKVASGNWGSASRTPIPLETDPGKLAAGFQTATIVGCALLEGAAFFALLAHMTEGHLLSLVAAGALLVGIALHFPLGDRVNRLGRQAAKADGRRTAPSPVGDAASER